MNYLFILLVLLFISCSPERPKKSSSLPGLPERIVLGESSLKDVEKELGTPLDTYEVEGSTINTFEGERSIQVENDIARSYFRSPDDRETKLQHWLQLWKDRSYKKQKIESTKDSHGNFEYQLICEELKTTVVYEEETGLVKRVIHYEN